MTEPILCRRDFLITSGATLSAAALHGCATSWGVLPPADARRRAVEDGRRPEVASELPPILQALAIGLNAPSPHNTQSWLFDLVNDREALLRIDAERLLPATDPPARQVHLGCGCFIEAFVLGASTFGWRAEVELFPRGLYRSETEIGELPVARLLLAANSTANSAAAHPLSAYIASRQTSRLVYSGDYLAPKRLTPVLSDATLVGSQVRLITREELPPYLRLLDEAMTIEFNTLATNEETRRWIRFTPGEAAREGDGLTFEANGVTGMSATMAGWFTEDTRESWNARGTIEKGLEVFREGLYSARGLLLLSTTQNGVVDHVQAGRDCYQLMLALTKHGYFCHPLNQVIQEYAEMRQAREAFEAHSGIRAPAKVQMILRAGRSATPYQSYRRGLASFVSDGQKGAG